MNKRLFSLLLALTLVFGMFPVSVLAYDDTQAESVTISVAGVEEHSNAASAVAQINALRAEQGLAPMNHNATLADLAMTRAAETAVYYSWSGFRPDGSEVDTIFADIAADWPLRMENTAVQYVRVEDYVTQWMNNDQLREAILSESYDQIGIGCFVVENNQMAMVLIIGHSNTDTASVSTDAVALPVIRQIRVQPDRVERYAAGEYEINLYAGEVGEVFFHLDNGNAGLSVLMIPQAVEICNRKGEVIATMTTSGTHHGAYDIQGVQYGIGTAELSFYEGQPEPKKLIVTYREHMDSDEPLVLPDPEAQDGGTWGENLQWTVEGTTLTISGTGAMEPEFYGVSSYPWEYYRDAIYDLVIEEGVTSVSEAAFWGFSQLKSLTLPGTMEQLGDRSFSRCPLLEAAELPDSVTSLGDSVFSCCAALASLRLSENLTMISGYAFSGTALQAVDIPASVTSIGQHAFDSCNALTAVTIPDTVQTMEVGVFENCTSLSSVTLPANLTELPGRTFMGCTALQSVELPAILQSIGVYAFHGSGLKFISVPESVTRISNNAFQDCAALSSVELPERMELIGSDCFSGCTSLKNLTLPEGITELNMGTFENSGLVSLEIPESVTVIRNNAFRGCTNLETLVIPDSVTVMPADTVEGCEKLTISCYNMSLAHLLAMENDIPVIILPDEPDTVFYPISVFGNNRGQIYMSATELPANRYFLIKIVPDAGYDLETLYYYRPDGSSQLVHEQYDHNEYLILMPECELVLEIRFMIRTIPFADVPEGEYYYQPVRWALSYGITAGTDAAHFSPMNPCTRAQVVTFLWRSAGEPEPGIADNPFVDVQPDAYYYKAVLWALENGITAGTDASHFSPDQGCTRAQVVTFLWRACGEPELGVDYNPFADVGAGEYYYHAVQWAAAYGITSGVDATRFDPNAICNRGQIVTFLYRTFY